MLVLDRNADAYPDDIDPAIRYRVPAGLAPLAGPDGTPQAMLSRGPDGGLLHLRLGPVWPALAARERMVAFESGRFRLVSRTPASSDTGAWRATPIVGAAVVDRSVTLDQVEAAIARKLGQGSGDVVDVEVELTFRGLAPAFPWLASVARTTLRARIGALLRSTPATFDEVEAAFLGLTEDTFTWHPLQAGALPPPRDEALRAIAQYAKAELFVESDHRYEFAEGGPARLDLSLAVPRVQTRTIGLRWSFSEFLAAQPDPKKHLIDVAIPAPFVAADLCVVNDVPLAANGITSVAVEVRTGGPTGIVRHEFKVGEPSAKRLRFVRESADALSIRWRARAAVLTATGPAIVESDEHAAGLLIEVNAATLGLKAIRFLAAKEVFDHAATIEVAVGNRTLSLTAAVPEAWAVGRQPPATVDVTARRSTGERFPLGAMACGPMGLTFDATTLGVGEFVTVVLRPPADLAQRAAYLGVQAEGHPWRTVEQGDDLALPMRRESRLVPPRIRYRSRVVARGAGGATSVVSDSAWRERTGDVVTIEL